jgi:hypothetical protein
VTALVVDIGQNKSFPFNDAIRTNQSCSGNLGRNGLLIFATKLYAGGKNMSQSTLIGSNRVTEADVIKVPAVPFTKSFHPVHHRQVIDAIRSGVVAMGLEIVNTDYALANNGNRMFGVWDLSGGSDELCWSIGIRNSMDKSMALGITAGTRVFVCENLAFSGDFVEFRRHTKGLVIDELEFMAYRAMKKMVANLNKFQAWHEGLKSFSLTEWEAKLLLVEIMTQNIIPPSKFARFNELYFGGVYKPNLWGFHETVTDVLRDSNLLTLPKKNRQLNGVLNAFIESRSIEPPSSLAEFFERRHLLSQH